MGHQLGLEYMVCPMLPKNLWTSAEGFREAAANFDTWGKRVHDAGMTFAFHNHGSEFKPQGDTPPASPNSSSTPIPPS